MTRDLPVLGTLTLLLLFLTGIGCTDLGPPIPEDELVGVLVDLHLLESRREIVGDMPPYMRDSVLAAHRISEKKFAAAIRYYADRPDEYLELYNVVIDSLSAELGQLEEKGRLKLQDPLL